GGEYALPASHEGGDVFGGDDAIQVDVAGQEDCLGGDGDPVELDPVDAAGDACEVGPLGGEEHGRDELRLSEARAGRERELGGAIGSVEGEVEIVERSGVEACAAD